MESRLGLAARAINGLASSGRRGSGCALGFGAAVTASPAPHPAPLSRRRAGISSSASSPHQRPPRLPQFQHRLLPCALRNRSSHSGLCARGLALPSPSPHPCRSRGSRLIRLHLRIWCRRQTQGTCGSFVNYIPTLSSRFVTYVPALSTGFSETYLLFVTHL